MGVYKEGKNWKVQVYYRDWQGNRKRKQKRGFRTKGEAKEWERDFFQQQTQSVDIEFGNFLELYYKDMEVRLRENTMYTKRYIIDLKIKPYFEHKVLSEITVADIRNWQNELLKQNYSETYLKTINCQLGAIFNYAVRYYNLKDNPCRKAGSIGKSKGEPKDFWMQDEFETFLETVDDKPEAKMAFQFLYWTGMRIGELLGLLYQDVNIESGIININKSFQVVAGEGKFVNTKTVASNRMIKMPEFLVNELNEYIHCHVNQSSDKRLFCFTDKRLAYHLNFGIEQTGVKKIQLHRIRQSHEKMLEAIGVPSYERWERLGTLRMNWQYAEAYSDHVPEKRVAVKLLNEIHTEQKMKKEVLRNGK